MTVSVALTGFGAWGKNLARVFAANGLANLKAIVDPDIEQRRAAAIAHPGVKTVEDLSTILEDPEIDAVAIATPTHTHYPLVGRALSAGKHVFCEKLLALTTEEATELSRLAARRNRVLMVGHIFLFNPGLAALKQVLDAGELGDIRYMAALRTNLGPVREDVNVVMDLAVHDISIMNFLMGAEPVQVSAVGQNFLRDGLEDVGFLTLSYPSGAIGNIHVSWLNPRKERRFTLVGTKQMAVWEDTVLESPLAIYDKKAETLAKDGEYGTFLQVALSAGGVWMPPVPPAEPLRLEMETFLRLAAGERMQNPSCGETATSIARVLDAARQSMTGYGAPVALR